MSASQCRRCNLPQFDGAYGYVGPTCKCFTGGPWVPYREWPVPPAQQNLLPGQTVEWKPLTEADVRRIVREEIAQAMAVHLLRLHADPANPINAGRTKENP